MAKTATIQAQQRWEYLEIVRRTETYLCKDLNELGQEGWELVSVDHGKDAKAQIAWTAFLKRPATAQAATTTTTRQEAAVAEPQPAAEPTKTGSDAGSEFDLSGDEFGIKEELEELKEPKEQEAPEDK